MAASRIPSLLASGADVTVVAPEVRYEIERLAVARRASAVPPRRTLDGAWLVVAAAPPEVNRAVGAAAERARRAS